MCKSLQVLIYWGENQASQVKSLLKLCDYSILLINSSLWFRVIFFKLKTDFVFNFLCCHSPWAALVPTLLPTEIQTQQRGIKQRRVHSQKKALSLISCLKLIWFCNVRPRTNHRKVGGRHVAHKFTLKSSQH